MLRSSRRPGAKRSDEFPISIALQPLHDRLERAREALQSARLSDIDMEIVQQIDHLGELSLSEIQIFAELGEITYQNASEPASRVSGYATQIESLSWDLLKWSLRYSEEQRRRLGEITERAGMQVGILQRESASTEKSLAEFQHRINEETVKVDALGHSLEAARVEQAEIFRAEIAAVSDERARAVSGARNEIERAVSAARELERSSANSHLKQIEGILDKSKVAASKVANETISSYYSGAAKKEIVSARIWALTAFVVGLIISGLVVTVVILSIFRPVENEFAAVLRIMAPLIGSPLFIYATLEAREHRKRAWQLEDSSITHSTIGAMIAPLPDTMQHGILVKAAAKMYVQDGIVSAIPSDHDNHQIRENSLDGTGILSVAPDPRVTPAGHPVA